jgi:hypothetical protein
MTDADYIHAFQQIVMPIALEFAPELVISESRIRTTAQHVLNILFAVSAGFDAADGDDLGECHVTPTGYAHMTHMLASLAGGKLVVALEVSEERMIPRVDPDRPLLFPTIREATTSTPSQIRHWPLLACCLGMLPRNCHP